MENCKKELIKRVLSKKCLCSVYQPIVSLRDGSTHAFEALSRITDEDIDVDISDLFSFASKCGYLWELEKLCRTNALKYAKNKPKDTKLLGSGFSGLNRLQTIKPNYVKIDYELVHEIHKDKSKKSLVRLLVKYCSDMDYKLIAEGIETEEELKCLINLGVEFGQGFFLRKPGPEFKKIDKQFKKLILDCQKKKYS